MAKFRQLTYGCHGHTIANRACWTADGNSIVFDTRVDETRFDSPEILRVSVASGQVDTVYRSPPTRGGAICCGVPTCSPQDDRVVFIRQDSPPSRDWDYCPWHRHGVIVRADRPDQAATLDARDLVSPFTPGALRGGTHLHTFHPTAAAVLSTYEDHLLATSSVPAEANRRCLAVHLLDHPVTVPQPSHPYNQDGISFSVVVSRIDDRPEPGSDQIAVATGEAWLGRQNRIAFQGTVSDDCGRAFVELFLLTLPSDLKQLMIAADRPLQGTATTRPAVPAGVSQTRLTHTQGERFPGLAGPRHWAVASPEGSRIGCFRRDDRGIVQFWTVDSSSGEPRQVSCADFEPTSAFTWHPDGGQVAYVADGSVMLVDVDTGRPTRLTRKRPPATAPTHHACVFSPDGSAIAVTCPVVDRSGSSASRFPQIHVVTDW